MFVSIGQHPRSSARARATAELVVFAGKPLPPKHPCPSADAWVTAAFVGFAERLPRISGRRSRSSRMKLLFGRKARYSRSETRNMSAGALPALTKPPYVPRVLTSVNSKTRLPIVTKFICGRLGCFREFCFESFETLPRPGAFDMYATPLHPFGLQPIVLEVVRGRYWREPAGQNRRLGHLYRPTQ